jgi:hypothetical protein
LIGKALAAVTLLCSVESSQALAQSPPADLWEDKDSWSLEVKPSDNNVYLVRLTITELDEQRWSLGFFPASGAPEGLHSLWHVVTVDKRTGFPELAWSEDDFHIKIEQVDKASFVTGIVDGVPLEWLNANELPEGKLSLRGKRTVEISKRTEGDKYLLEMIVMDGDVEQLRVLQTWVNGEKWWHSYERRVKGELVLSARLLDVDAVKGKEADSGETAISYSQRPVIALDPRLKGRVELIARHPKVEDVLGILSSETGLKLSIDPDLAEKPPDLGEIELHSAVCWSVMNYIAVRYPVETAWRKSEDGYVLMAVPSTNEQPSWWKRIRVLLILAGSPLLAILGTAAGIVMLRRRAATDRTQIKPSAAEPQPQGYAWSAQTLSVPAGR